MDVEEAKNILGLVDAFGKEQINAAFKDRVLVIKDDEDFESELKLANIARDLLIDTLPLFPVRRWKDAEIARLADSASAIRKTEAKEQLRFTLHQISDARYRENLTARNSAAFFSALAVGMSWLVSNSSVLDDVLPEPSGHWMIALIYIAVASAALSLYLNLWADRAKRTDELVGRTIVREMVIARVLDKVFRSNSVLELHDFEESLANAVLSELGETGTTRMPLFLPGFSVSTFRAQQMITPGSETLQDYIDYLIKTGSIVLTDDGRVRATINGKSQKGASL